MKTTRHLTMKAALALSISSVSAVDDFAHLTAHWNFDEGRDWHNMPYPYQIRPSHTADLVGERGICLHATKAPNKLGNDAWVAGRQYSGVRGLNYMVAKEELCELNGSCTLSFWMRLNGEPNTRGIIGSEYTALWGAMNKEGQVGLRIKGRPAVMSATRLRDSDWHHIVITRDADSGKLELYLDGKLESTATGPKGSFNGHFQRLAANAAALDQIHLFDCPISSDTVKKLYDNHAPQVFTQDYLVETTVPSATGSVLSGFTYDVDDDTLRVSRHTQPKHGRVELRGDGAFIYTPNADFAKTGRDEFMAVVTDGRGGYTQTTIRLHDSRHEIAPPVEEFRYFGALPEFTPGAGKQQKHRNPMAIQLGGSKPDLLVQADSRLWLFANESTGSKLLFDEPIVLKNTDNSEVETDGAAVLSGNRLIVRRPNGTLYAAEITGCDVPRLQAGADIRDTTGAAFTCPARHFVLIDCDKDGTPDLVGGFNDGLYYYKGGANLTFAPEKQALFKRSYNIAPAVGDLNSDGRPELMYGINWGTLHAWINSAEPSLITQDKYMELRLENEPAEKYLRTLNGAHVTVADFNGDGTPDMVLGGNAGRELVSALGISSDEWAGNLQLIEQELYDGHAHELGTILEADNQKGLTRYRELMARWIRWAVSRTTPAERRRAFDMLCAHVKKYPFLQRSHLADAWVKKENGKVSSWGAMHHVPGIFTMNWIVLHRLLPDSPTHRAEVADALGMPPGTDREVYLSTGMPLADNNKSSVGQLLANRDMLRHHARILFPDDHLSIDVNFGDGRDAMCYIFESNKNTFGMSVAQNLAEMHGDMVKLAEQCFGSKGAADGNYYTFVLAHEVCHSLDAYVRSRANKDLNRRWGDQNFYAATNAGLCDDIVADDSGWWNRDMTRERFRERGYWDGKNENWDAAWKSYWEQCPYRDKVFMRGQIDWFLNSQQETFATQANHHWARSEARLTGAILRYLQGYKSNINEVVFFIDILSAGQNKLPFFHTRGEGNPPMVNFNVEYAWLTRNDRGHITDIRIGNRHYGFEVAENGRVTGLRCYPFADIIRKAAHAAP